MTLSPLTFLNSFLVAAGVSALCLVLGLAAAICERGLPARLQSTFRLMALLVLVLPPFLLITVALALFGTGGHWPHTWPGSIYSVSGVAVILTGTLWPICFVAWRAAWVSIQSEHLEVETSLVRTTLLRGLLLPVGVRLAGIATLVTAALALGQVTVPTLLQTNLLGEIVWLRFNTQFDFVGSLEAALPMVLAPALLLWVVTGRTLFHGGLGRPLPPSLWRSRLGWVYALGSVVSVLVVLGSLVLPVAWLLFQPSTHTALAPTLEAGQRSLWASLSVGLISAVVGGVLGLAVAGRRFWVAVSWFGFLVPGMVWGVVTVMLFNNRVLGWAFPSLALMGLVQGFHFAALAASLIHFSQPTRAAGWHEAASLSGASRFQQWRWMRMPRLLPAVLAGAGLVFAFSLWDAETQVFLMPPGGETLALRLFNLLHYGHAPQANALSLILLSIPCLVCLLAFAARPVLRACLKQPWLTAAPLAVAALAGSGCGPLPEGQAALTSQRFQSAQALGTRGVGPGQFNKPRSLACDLQGELFVIDMSGRLQKFSAFGEYERFWDMPQTEKGKPKGMDRDPAGGVILVEPHYTRVNHFTSDGKLRLQWGVNGTNSGQLAFPRSVAVGPSGDLYVSEYGPADRIQCFSRDGGTFRFAFGSRGTAEGQFDRAEGIGVDAKGRVYVADSGNHRVQVFDSNGKFVRSIGRAGQGAGELSYPYDVKVDANGVIYICEFGNSRIQLFDQEGRSLEILGGAGAGLTQLNNPWGICFDSSGNLYVADALNHRVVKYVRRPGGAT